MPKLETRTVPAQIELRESKKAGSVGLLVGHAAVFDRESVDLGGFTEFVRAGAFDEALAEPQDTRCLRNHIRDVLLGRVKSGTLRLSVDSTGLLFENDLPDNEHGRTTRVSVERGDMDGCSFGFRIRSSKGKPGDNWWEDEKSGKYHRELLNLDLIDVGPVTMPAYEDTDVSARSQDLLQDFLSRRDSERSEVCRRWLEARQRQMTLS